MERGTENNVVKLTSEAIKELERQYKETGIFDKRKYHEYMDLIMDLVLYYHLGRIIRPIHFNLKEKNNEFMQLDSIQRNIIGNLAAKGDCTVGELAGFTSCSYKNMSKYLKDIEEVGYVARYTNPKNMRYTYVKLTEKGKEFHGRFQAETNKEAQRLFDSCFSDELQLEIIKRYTALGEVLSEFDGHLDEDKENGDNAE